MAPDPKAVAAMQAMKSLGINGSKVKPVLKTLIRLYERNWTLIEEDNYRALIDAIFEAEDTATTEKNKSGKNVNEKDLLEEDEHGPEPEPPLKRLRRERDVNQSPELMESRIEGSHVSPQTTVRNKGKEPIVADNCLVPYKPSYHGVVFKEPMSECGRIVPKDKVTDMHHQLIEPKDEPYTDDIHVNDIVQYEAPIAVIHPDPMSKRLLAADNIESGNSTDPMGERDIPMESGEFRTDIGKESAPECVMETNGEAPPVQDGPSSNLNVATSPLGEVKLFLSCNSAVGRRKFRMPTLDAVITMTEEKCQHSYKITDPKFSVMKLLRHVCESFLELGTDSINEPQDHPNGTVHVPMNLDVMSGSIQLEALEGSKENAGVPLQTTNKPVATEFHVVAATSQTPVQAGEDGSDILNELLTTCQEEHAHDGKNSLESGSAVVIDGELEDSKSTDLWDLVVVPQCEMAPGQLISLDDVKDITRGEEWVQIPWINEISYDCPSTFRYITQGIVYKNAKLGISLSRIGDSSCCPTCFGDCLSAPVPCACARETGGQFAYTTEGIVKEGFLEECISMSRDPQHQCLIFCKECPLEKSKNDDCLEPCKGHLKRKFIKECWMKCGCTKKCGNRVVQRGITHNLQVFVTSDERGWGLRTLEELQKGTFVCEYVGEILTSSESHDRNMKSSNTSGKETYVTLLDAGWGSKQTLDDEKALCLDASQFGNVARFINHRCLDANLVEIPVEVETPDRHYYRVGLFTTRKVEALEELTWDYGIDFDDHDHLIKSFLCRCGSKFCRNIKRQNRPKLMPVAS